MPNTQLAIKAAPTIILSLKDVEAAGAVKQASNKTRAAAIIERIM